MVKGQQRLAPTAWIFRVVENMPWFRLGLSHANSPGKPRMVFSASATICATIALMSEAYPTAARATAQNVLFNVGRTVGSLAPLTVGALAAKYSFSAAIALLASIYILDILATVFLIPELKGKELE